MEYLDFEKSDIGNLFIMSNSFKENILAMPEMSKINEVMNTEIFEYDRQLKSYSIKILHRYHYFNLWIAISAFQNVKNKSSQEAEFMHYDIRYYAARLRHFEYENYFRQK